MIKELETKAEREALAAAVSPDAAPPPLTPQQAAVANRLAAMKFEVQEITHAPGGRKQEDARLQGLMGSYTNRLDAVPALESELTELTRDYATLQEQYTTLLRKSEESKIAVNLERRQIGEQFKVIDGARLPERPISPNRVQINLMGLLAGLGARRRPRRTPGISGYDLQDRRRHRHQPGAAGPRGHSGNGHRRSTASG